MSEKTSICVDCETPIVGEIQRCGACQEQHLPRREDSLSQRMLVWLVGAEILFMIICGLVLATRCV